MQLVGFLVLLTVGLGGSGAVQRAVAVEPRLLSPIDGRAVAFVGCVVKGKNGYVVAPVGDPNVPVRDRSEARMVFWIDDADALVRHSGHRVEVRGRLEEERETGTVAVEREQHMLEMEVTVRGETITARFEQSPASNNAAVGTTGILTDDEQELRFVVRKLDVESVKVVTGSCSW